MQPIEVSINPQTKKEYFDDVFGKRPGLESALLRDFVIYKTTSKVPEYFGRDVAYTQPHGAYKAGLMHIHLCLPPKKFPSNKPQADRTCRKGDPANDVCLVYVQGELYENRYSLIAIMHPNAHEKGRDAQIMSYLSRVAQDFVDKN
ncbi:type II toxin-antitoxin system YafO family toxin [Yersinia mollaretii]|uniref:type II toxin-antitoxin system YafO family toxin n=1 Tax=Yersinia mollaretii TaxID=33060 RepID=UPI0011AAB59F|nr:type II toxin-antitoxin system YafO family toxin [Yersinia mollaretii]